MSDISGLRLWTMRGSFVLLALVILIGNLLPLQTVPRNWAGPDLLFCFAMVWSVRRPEFVPMWLLALLFLLADLLLSRAPGLVAALMLLACHNLQTHIRQVRDAGFAAEWTRAALLIAAVMLGTRFILNITLVPAPPLGLTLFQIVATIACYPIVIALSRLVFGIRSTAPGELDSYGQRL